MWTVIKEWAMTMRFIDWFSLMSGICSIIALIIALFQIADVKSKVQVAEDGISKILSMREHEKLEAALSTIKNQHAELTKLQSIYGKQGTSSKTVTEKSESIIGELSRCMCEMPVSEGAVADSVRNVIELLRTFDSKDKLKEAEGFLYGAIQQMKVSIENYRKQEISIASKQ